jgi:hypothetical protein
MTDDAAFEVGRNLAVTPGQVVFENELIQLIQYAPATAKVHERPLLIVPPCINKFYILDLQPENSFVAHAVAQGITVFLVSWRNPQAELGHLGWDDYLELGALKALEVAREVSGADQLNALGFCVGGTILSAALSVAKARGEEPAASLTLLTTLLDFSDGGEVDPLRRSGLRCRARGGHRRRRPAARRRAGGGLLQPARQRPHLAVRRRQLPQGRQAAGLRPALLERRQHQSARTLRRLVPAPPLPGERPARAGPADDVRHRGRPRPARHAGLHLLQPRGSHRALEERLSIARHPRRRDHLRHGRHPATSPG